MGSGGRTPQLTQARRRRGSAAHAAGTAAEDAVAAALAGDGWTILGRRLRTAAGEIDIAAERDGLLALVEVKQRATLAHASAALSPRQQARLSAAAAILLGEHPAWGAAGVRFDLVAVDRAGTIRRIIDAWREQ